MSYADLWVDIIRLLLYNQDDSVGPGTVRSPTKQAAAWLQVRAGCADLRGLKQPAAPHVPATALLMRYPLLPQRHWWWQKQLDAHIFI